MGNAEILNELIDNSDYMFHMSDIYDVDSQEWYCDVTRSNYGTEEFYKMNNETLEKIMEAIKHKEIFEAEILNEEE